ncbi:hypothetical protein OS21_44380 [Dickeya oryzae]
MIFSTGSFITHASAIPIMHDIRKNEEEKFVNGLEKKKNPIHKDKDPPHVIEFYFIFKIKIKLTQAKKKKKKHHA